MTPDHQVPEGNDPSPAPFNEPPKKNIDLEIRHRRAEKGWRFRDIQHSWTHFVWTLITTAQTIILGIVAVVSTLRPDTTTKCLLQSVFILTSLSLSIFYVLSVWKRSICSKRAMHFERSVEAEEQGKPYDNKAADRSYETRESIYVVASGLGEAIAVLTVIGNVVCLGKAMMKLE
ncbi:hypothetical protein CA54_10960 [Symmachiella macrocystis]|uniref:Uncharacterized protein n=1 Tax=Symmachiella macrocystis TaxID=2527985 RepID=A0A5C6BJD0_9PLAN|nr:hypothetical protein [Symmachiella macrocystis]TWU12273.1 hypothetical protein CA54_10960 [Symmachiella macrocystis]